MAAPDLSPAAIVARRDRRKAIYDEFSRTFGAELHAIEVAERAAEKRTKDIIWSGAAISGRPNRMGGIRYGHVTITSGTVTAEIMGYCGEGNYEVGERIKFPTAWLAMPDAEWQAALRAEVAATKQRRADAAARKAEALREQAEASERATLARLTAKYTPTPPAAPGEE